MWRTSKYRMQTQSEKMNCHTSRGPFMLSNKYISLNTRNKKTSMNLWEVVEKGDQISDANIINVKRQNEWQECFNKAMTCWWMARIQEVMEDSAIFDLSREYFYVISSNETFVLWVIRETRIGKVKYLSMIVSLSLTTKETRALLSTMGITLKSWQSNGDCFGE